MFWLIENLLGDSFIFFFITLPSNKLS